MSVKKKIIIGISAGLAALLIALIAISVWAVNSFSDSGVIASNITFKGVYIGDITKEEAIDRLKGESFPISQVIRAGFNDKSFEFAPDAAGLTYDFEAICENANSFGRQGGFFNSLFEIIKSRTSYTEIEPVYSYDENTFKNTINTIARANGIEFENLTVNVYENYASVKINKDIEEIDIKKLYEDTMAIIDNKEERSVALSVVKAEKVTANEIYDSIYVEPKNAKVEVTDGVTIVTPHTIGVLLDIKDIESRLNEDKWQFTVPVTKKYPEVRVEHLSGNLFTDVLGSWTTKYNEALVGRTINVTRAASKINGVILNKDDVFSYNNIVGPRTREAGFSVGTIFTNAGLSEEMGGGICQTSSTLYNAVLYADLQIVERRNHMYAVSYVKNGLDATVAYGSIDFKFKNNKNNPVKIVSSYGNGTLTVTILGKKQDNNKVELYTNTLASYPFEEKEVPKADMAPGTRKVTQNGSLGYRVTATKVVKDSNGNVIRQEALGTDVYKPLAKIVEVGPALEVSEPVDTIIQGTTDPEKGLEPEITKGNEEEVPEEEKTEASSEVKEEADVKKEQPSEATDVTNEM